MAICLLILTIATPINAQGTYDKIMIVPGGQNDWFLREMQQDRRSVSSSRGSGRPYEQEQAERVAAYEAGLRDFRERMSEEEKKKAIGESFFDEVLFTQRGGSEEWSDSLESLGNVFESEELLALWAEHLAASGVSYDWLLVQSEGDSLRAMALCADIVNGFVVDLESREGDADAAGEDNAPTGGDGPFQQAAAELRANQEAVAQVLAYLLVADSFKSLIDWDTDDALWVDGADVLLESLDLNPQRPYVDAVRSLLTKARSRTLFRIKLREAREGQDYTELSEETQRHLDFQEAVIMSVVSGAYYTPKEATQQEKTAASNVTLAKNYIRQGMHEEAQQELEAVVQEYPDTPSAEKATDMLTHFVDGIYVRPRPERQPDAKPPAGD